MRRHPRPDRIASKAMAKAAARRATSSYVRLTPFVRGVIYGFFLARYTLDESREEVVKSDGAALSRQTIAEIIRVAADRGDDPCDENSGHAWR